jgi:hypothetical protein
MSPRPGQPAAGPGWLARLAAALPATSALVLSFDGLSALARASRVADRLAYLFPIALDATGVVASVIWLDRRMPADARRAARLLALATILLSISGNGLWHWLVETGTRPHVAVQIAVGAVVPAILFGLGHVWQLANRRPTGQPGPTSPRTAYPAGQPGPAIVVHGLHVSHTQPGPAPSPTELTWPGPRAQIGQPAAPVCQLAAQPGPDAPASQPAPLAAQPGQPVTGLASLPASPGQPGGWRTYLDPARPLLAAQPDIGRLALAAELRVPESVARKVLDHLRAEPAAEALALPIGVTTS